MNTTPPKAPTWPWVTAFVAIATVLGNGVAFMIDRATQADLQDHAQQVAVINSLNLEIDRLNSQREKDYLRIAELQTQYALATREMVEKELELARSGSVPPLEIVRQLVTTHPGYFWAKLRLGYNNYLPIGVSQKYADKFLEGNVVGYLDGMASPVFSAQIESNLVKIAEGAFDRKGGLYTAEIKVEGGVLKICKWHVRLSTGQDIIFGTGEFVPSTLP